MVECRPTMRNGRLWGIERARDRDGNEEEGEDNEGSDGRIGTVRDGESDGSELGMTMGQGGVGIYYPIPNDHLLNKCSYMKEMEQVTTLSVFTTHHEVVNPP